jgi:predicted unusual protein kinase regulating ubiquinone biosynthesis (AarF/ABC1/UbiB family)
MLWCTVGPRVCAVAVVDVGWSVVHRQIWDRLHRRHAPEMLRMVQRLKGYYVKICQFGSSRLDILPMLWVEHLRQALCAHQ